MNTTLQAKEVEALELLTGLERVVVAFSGGVDSSVLLSLARQALGDAALAVLADSASLPNAELRQAQRIATLVGARLEIVSTAEMDDPRYVANRGDRCFWCRTALVDALEPIAEKHRAQMIYGAILDDLGDDRPGMRAAEGRGMRAPLVEVGLSKSEIRQLALQRNLPVWDKPAQACLSSRVARGLKIEPRRLARIELAESALREIGLRQFRVRDHGQLARLELGETELQRVLEQDQLRARVMRVAVDSGFICCVLDLDGYRPAGLAESLRPLPRASG